jgi:hypothetical protein
MEMFGIAVDPGKVSTFAVLVVMALAVITDKLVWHTRLKKAEDRADRWEQIALEALTAGAQAGVKAAEVAVGVVSAIPDPQGERDSAARNR